jgi:antitoxin VapB
MLYKDTRYALEERLMAFHIKKPETDALAHELEREQGRPSLVDLSVQFCPDLRTKANPQNGKPADKAFRDSLYEEATPSSTKPG